MSRGNLATTARLNEKTIYDSPCYHISDLIPSLGEGVLADCPLVQTGGFTLRRFLGLACICGYTDAIAVSVESVTPSSQIGVESAFITNNCI